MGLLDFMRFSIRELHLSVYHRTPSGNPRQAVVQFVNSALLSLRLYRLDKAAKYSSIRELMILLHPIFSTVICENSFLIPS